MELKATVETSVAKATEYASEARQLAAHGNFEAAKEMIELAAAHFSKSETYLLCGTKLVWVINPTLKIASSGRGL